MILAAERHGCVREVLVIAAALSIQDVRERPREQRERADELHRRFTVPGSDLMSIVALWDYVKEQQKTLSGNAFRRMCRDEYLNWLRVREWRDLYSQLRQVAGQIGIRPGTDVGHPDRVHQAVLSGLLSNIGRRDERRPQRDRRTRVEYQGARGARFEVVPGSAIGRAGSEWVVAAEVVETDRLRARRVSAIQPEWIEPIAGDSVTRSYGEPEWNATSGRAVIPERARSTGLQSSRDVASHCRQSTRSLLATCLSRRRSLLVTSISDGVAANDLSLATVPALKNGSSWASAAGVALPEV